MKLITSFAVASKQFTLHSAMCQKLECRVGDSAAAVLFLQIHDSAVTPAAASVPIKSWPVQTSQEVYKEFKKGELDLGSGFFVCLSTTEATLTIATGNDVMAMVSAELFGPDEPSGSTFVGDLTTPVSNLTIWTLANGPRRLRAFEVINGNATEYYLMLFAKQPTAGDRPLEQFKIAASTSYLGVNAFKFGRDGRDVRESIGNTLNEGCRLYLSTTPVILTTTTDSINLKVETKT